MKVATVNSIEDTSSILSHYDNYARRFPHLISFIRTNTWNVRLFPKPVGKKASRSYPETSEEIASFCSDFNARNIPNSERQLSASSKTESKLTTLPSTVCHTLANRILIAIFKSFSSIFIFVPRELSTGTSFFFADVKTKPIFKAQEIEGHLHDPLSMKRKSLYRSYWFDFCHRLNIAQLAGLKSCYGSISPAAGRFILGKTVLEGTVFPNTNRPRPVNNIFIFS